MNRHTSVLLTAATLSVLAGSVGLSTNQAGALSYRNAITQSFTLNESLTVSVSNANIIINNLLPDETADSNVVDITITSNNLYGYTLNGSVGNDTYTNRNLTNSVRNPLEDPSDQKYIFTSLDFESETDTLEGFDDNTWGFTISKDGGTTWDSYSGLPYFSDTTNILTLKASDAPSAEGGDSIAFKIGAKAGKDKPAGEYRNVINFVVTAAPAPPPEDRYLQDVDKWGASLSVGETTTVKDNRDNKEYLVGRMADGNIWMLDNLALSDSSIEINSENSDFPEGREAWHLPTAVAVGETLYDEDLGGTYYTIPDWEDTYTDPMIVSAFNDEIPANNDTISETEGYKVGTYYNYCAATAGTYCHDPENYDSNNETWNDATGFTSLDAEYSICPKGWHLPSAGDYGPSEYGNFVSIYLGFDSTLSAFRRAGRFPFSGGAVEGVVAYQGSGAAWWSSTFGNDEDSYDLGMGEDEWGSEVVADDYVGRYVGFTVRCVAP